MIAIGTGDRLRLQREQADAARRNVIRDRIRALKRALSPGRRVGKPAGSHVGDLQGLSQSIVLCRECRPFFAPNPDRPPRDYRYDRFLRVSGKCDGCREFDHQGNLHLFVHESAIGVSHKLMFDDSAERQRRSIARWEAKFPSIAKMLRSA